MMSQVADADGLRETRGTAMPELGRRLGLPDIALYSLLLLIFFQLIADFVEAVYAFGLLGTSIPPEIASVLFLFSPLVLLLLPRGLSGWPLVLAGEVMLLCRVLEPLLDTRGKMLVAGLGVACFLVLFPSLLRQRQDRGGEPAGLVLGMALTVALSLSVLLRTLGSGSDISTYGLGQAIGWVLAAITAGLLLTYRASGPATAGAAGTPAPGRARLPTWRTLALCLGLAGVLVLCYFAFTSPTVIARWTGASYLLVVSVVALVLGLVAYLLATRPRLLTGLAPAAILAWNVLFLLALVLTILAHQVTFPADPGGYPLPEPPVTWLHYVPLFLTLILFPVIVVDMMLFVQALVAGRPSPRALAGGFSLASLYLLIMIFAQVFTTVYDYIPVVGPFFRDRFWLVFLLAGMVVALPVLVVGRDARGPAPSGPWPGKAFAGLVGLAAVATVGGALLTASRPAPPPALQTSLAVLTFNIQQGYSEDGLKSYDAQLDLIRSMNPDIVGLQESDTARIAGGNSDVVRTFADRLDMYSYYGPKTVPGTFGIALLSKYPIEKPRTFYMYSEGEQTATIQAQITVGGKRFNVFVTHLGNGGPIVQQEAILQEVAGKENVVLMGDFNFRPDTEQYRLTTSVLVDSWLLSRSQGAGSEEIDPARRIDHIFLSPGMEVAASQCLACTESDHPTMMTVIEW